MEEKTSLAIECKDIIKDYPGHRALDGVSFTVKKGSFHGFLGPNGAGKTTTMRILSGLLGYDEGELSLMGEGFEKIKPQLPGLVGLMPELPPLYHSLTVKDMLSFAGELKHLPRLELERNRAELIERCQLESVYKRYIGTLSKGYKQRVGLAVALIHRPPIVILDEPTVGLDPVSLGPIRELLLGLKGEHTVLFSSHILSEVQTLCDSVTIIDRGRVLQSGRTHDIASTLSDQTFYQLETQEEGRELEVKLAAIEGVKSVTLMGPGKFEIVAMGSADPRARIGQVVIESGAQLLGLAKKELSLEEIFKQVTATKGPK